MGKSYGLYKCLLCGKETQGEETYCDRSRIDRSKAAMVSGLKVDEWCSCEGCQSPRVGAVVFVGWVEVDEDE
ncbi:MAG: hypothetical protein FWB93_03325 [Oscillospiraceae bacterium]|nr:hypothetical protein [Oscillospiraceae bacterium]